MDDGENLGSDQGVSSKNIFIGAALAIVGNLLISISMNIQKYSHLRQAEEKSETHYLKSKIWWVGLTLMVLGEIGNFSAYGFSPASLVAPLGTTTVIANAIIAVVFLRERVRYQDVFGVTLAIVGAFLLITFSTKEFAELTGKELASYLRQWPFLIYLVLEVVIFCVLLFAQWRYELENVVIFLLLVALLGFRTLMFTSARVAESSANSIANSSCQDYTYPDDHTSLTYNSTPGFKSSAVFNANTGLRVDNLQGSLTVISAKAVSSMINITLGGNSQLGHPLFYVMLIVMITTAIAQVKFLNRAMQSFDATVVVPTNFVLFTISAIISGIVLYKEFYGLTFLEIFMFLFGCVLSFIGVYYITSERKQEESDEQLLLTNADLFPGFLSLSSSKLIAVQPSNMLTASHTEYPMLPGKPTYESTTETQQTQGET